MAKHWETALGATDEWYTPPEIFKALGLTFDLDPASSGNDFVPARHRYTKECDGLRQRWFGVVWLNPPFGPRNGVVPWLDRFFEHGQGIVLVPARTSAGWFHDYIPRADAVLFPRGKTKFVRPDGSVGKSPGHGVVLAACGGECADALRYGGLGIFYLTSKKI